MDDVRVAKILVRNRQGKFLVVREEESGKWELPGGIIEDTEDRFEAGKRELEEETGLRAESFQDVLRIELESDELVDCYVLFTEKPGGYPETGGEVDDFRWVTVEEFQGMSWHRDSAYNIVPMKYLDDYLETENNYGEGEEIDVVKVLIRNEEGKFLAVQKTAEDKIHSGHKYTLYGRMAGKWELPGGRFKGAGDRFDAARREVKEECGIELGKMQDVVREVTEEKNAVNVYIVYTDSWEGEVELSKEHQDLQWVKPGEYLELDWHQDAGYGYPPMEFLESYLSEEKSY